jgi:hypothetical protein
MFLALYIAVKGFRIPEVKRIYSATHTINELSVVFPRNFKREFVSSGSNIIGTSVVQCVRKFAVNLRYGT